jgi:hypothetical protein
MGARTATRPVVLGAGALIAVERGDRRVLALCRVATLDGAPVVVPAGVVAQVWRDGGRQVQLARLVSATGTFVEPLDLEVARLAGVLCGRADTSDIVDATVVIAARRHHAQVLSGDRDDLIRLDPSVCVIDV